MVNSKVAAGFYNKSCSYKFYNIHRNMPALKKRLQHKRFLVNIAKFLRSPVLKNISKRLLLSDIISTRSTKSNVGFSTGSSF